jgi:excisionase family DNA binding protein
MEEEMMKTTLAKLDNIECYSLLAAKKILNIEDVSLLTGLSKSHLYKLTYRREIPHYKPAGKVLYFDRAEIENWMKQNKVTSNSEIDEMANNYLMDMKLGRRRK